jgi:hypothetical protein
MALLVHLSDLHMGPDVPAQSAIFDGLGARAARRASRPTHGIGGDRGHRGRLRLRGAARQEGRGGLPAAAWPDGRRTGRRCANHRPARKPRPSIRLAERCCCSTATSTYRRRAPCVTGLVCASDSCKSPCTQGVPTGSAGGRLLDQTCTAVAGASQPVEGGLAIGGDGAHLVQTGARASIRRSRLASPARVTPTPTSPPRSERAPRTLCSSSAAIPVPIPTATAGDPPT